MPSNTRVKRVKTTTQSVPREQTVSRAKQERRKRVILMLSTGLIALGGFVATIILVPSLQVFVGSLVGVGIGGGIMFTSIKSYRRDYGTTQLSSQRSIGSRTVILIALGLVILPTVADKYKLFNNMFLWSTMMGMGTIVLLGSAWLYASLDLD